MFFKMRFVFREVPPDIKRKVQSEQPGEKKKSEVDLRDRDVEVSAEKEYLRRDREYLELEDDLKTLLKDVDAWRYESDPEYSQRAEALRQLFRVLADENKRSLAQKACDTWHLIGSDDYKIKIQTTYEPEVAKAVKEARMYDPDNYQLYDLFENPKYRREVLVKCYPRFQETIDKLKIYELPNFHQACVALMLAMEEHGVIKTSEDLEKWKPALGIIQTRAHREVITWLVRHDLLQNPIILLQYKKPFSEYPSTEEWYKDEAIQFLAEHSENLQPIYEKIGKDLDYYLSQIPAIDYQELEGICLSKEFSPQQKSEKIAALFKDKNYPRLMHAFCAFCGEIASFICYAKDRPETRQFVERSGIWQKTQVFFEKNWKVYSLLFPTGSYYLGDEIEVHGNGFNLRGREGRGIGGKIDMIPDKITDWSLSRIEESNSPLALSRADQRERQELQKFYRKTLKELGITNLDEAIAMIWQARQPDGTIKAKNSEENERLQKLLGRSPFYNGVDFFRLSNRNFFDCFDVQAQIVRAYPDLAVSYSHQFNTLRAVTAMVDGATTNWEKLYTVNAGDTPQTREGIALWNQYVSRHDRFLYAGSDLSKGSKNTPGSYAYDGFHAWPDEYLIRLIGVPDSRQKIVVAKMLENSDAVYTYFQRLTYRRVMNATDYQQFKDINFDQLGGAGDTNGLAHAQDTFMALIRFAKNPEATDLRKQFFERRYTVYCSPKDLFKKFMAKKGSMQWSIYDWFEFHGRKDKSGKRLYTEDNQFVDYQGWEHPCFGYITPWNEMKDLKNIK